MEVRAADIAVFRDLIYADCVFVIIFDVGLGFGKDILVCAVPGIQTVKQTDELCGSIDVA